MIAGNDPTFDLLAIGEVMAELRRNPDLSGEASGAFAMDYAGDTYNTAVYCARVLHQTGENHRVGYHTRLGLDPLSRDFESRAGAENLTLTDAGPHPDRALGIYAVETDGAGERSFSYWRDASAARTLFATRDEALALPKAQIIYLSGITLAILSPDAREHLMEALRQMQAEQNTMVAFDSNYRPRLWEDVGTARTTIAAMWALADIALPSMDDELALFAEPDEQSVRDRFAKRDWVACAIKRGERGPLALSKEVALEFPRASTIVDTTAAGDSFNGAYLASMLLGEYETTRLLRAHKIASTVIGHPGAIIPRSIALTGP